MWINYVCCRFADCFFLLSCCFLPAVGFVSRETCGFPHCPMCFLYLFQCILVFYRFLFPLSFYLTERALFSAFCRRRCFLCVVSHETRCILLSRLSYFLFILCPLFISCLTDGVVFQHSVVVAACVVSHETLRFFLYLTSLFRFFSHFFFLMLLVRFSATKVDCFYPFSLLFSLFFAQFFFFPLSSCRSGE